MKLQNRVNLEEIFQKHFSFSNCNTTYSRLTSYRIIFIINTVTSQYPIG